MRARIRLFIATTAALATVGCSFAVDQPVSGKAQPGPGEARNVVVAGATAGGCAKVAAAYCAALLRCNPHWFEVDFPDLATCEARMGLGCARSSAAASAAGLAADLDSCLATLDAGCGALIPGTLPSCAFRPGALAADAPCAVDGQCVTLRCQLDNKGCGTCAKGPATPGACGGGVCAGEAREVGADCNKGGCAHALGLYCHGASARCQAIAMQGAGKGCDMTGIMTGAQSECRDGFCMNFNDMGSGQCMAFAADGAACDSWAGPPCRPPARCLAGHCAVPPVVCADGG